jgi:peptide/nickel transport system substrate-binding protein
MSGARTGRNLHKISAVVRTAILIAGLAALAKPVLAQNIVRIGVSVLPPGIGNPYRGITLPATLTLQAVFDTLTALDDSGNPIPALATEWRAESPTAWVFKLRDGVKFSNGEPLTADALITSAQHMNTPQGQSETIGSTLIQVAEAEAIDPLTVRVKLKTPDVLFPLHASVWRVPAPASWKALNLATESSRAVGSGPYVIDSESDSKVVMRANKNSWRPPKADGMEVILIADPTARLQAFVSGAIDIAVGLSLDAKEPVEAAKGKLFSHLTPQVDMDGFDTARPGSPLVDPRVRVALNMAVNRQLIVDQILEGATKPASQLAFPGAFGYDPALKPIPYDPAEAKKLLAQAGFDKGMSLKMAVSTGQSVGDSLYYEQIAADLKKVGVQLELIARPQARLMQDVFAGSLDTDLFTWVARGNDLLADYRFRACMNPSPARVGYHCDAELTPLLVKASAETDLDARRKLYGEILAFEQRSPPGLFLWQRPEFDALSAKISGYQPSQDMMRLDQVELRAH